MSRVFAPRSVVNEVIELLNSGDTAAAEKICRDSLERNPRDVNILAILGATLMKRRCYDQAETVLRQVIALAPTFAKPHEDLGYILLETGCYEEAEHSLREALRLDPSLESAWFNLGKALAALGKGKEADAAFEKSFSLSPERKALAYAAKAHQEGRLDEAERQYRKVLRNNPNNVDALRLLGNIAMSAKRVDEAIRLLRKAVNLAPDFAGAIIDLGRIYKDEDRYEEAIDCFRQAIEIEPENAKAWYWLGTTCAPAALTGEAIQAHRKALEINPRHGGAMLGLGHTLKTMGQQDEAIEAYRNCMQLKPDNGEIHWSLANLKTYRFTDEELADMEQRVESGELKETSRINFLFALGKARDDRGDYEHAWQFYRQGNQLRRMQEKYDPVQTEVMNNSIITVFNSELLDGKTGCGFSDTAPIFILGLPRSGSTLLEQILASHSQVEGTAELPYLGRLATSLNRNRADGINYPEAVRELKGEHLSALGADYIRMCGMHRKEGAPYFIDKMPNNFPTIGFLHLILPNAKIIDARRNPMDACLGCYRQLFAKGQTFTYDLVDIGEYYLQYQRMMDHWHEVLPGRVLTVQYEEVVTDLENQVRRILDYCGLPWDSNCVQFHETERAVRTASSEQVRQPIYTGAVNHWRHYEDHLEELKEVLQPLLERYKQYDSINRT